MNKKIVFLSNVDCGGAERMAVLYAKILKECGFDCQLLLLQYSYPDNFPLLPFIPSDIHYVVIKGRARYLPYKIITNLKKLKPDIVFGAIVPNSNYLLLIRMLRLFSFKVIVRMNTSPDRIPYFDSLFAKKMFKKADLVISQTREMTTQIQNTYNVNSNKIVTIYNPIDISIIKDKIKEKTSLSFDYINFVAIGRIHPVKDYTTLIRAFSLVNKRITKSRLYIVGDFPHKKEKENIEQLIIDLDLSNNVFLEGLQPNPYKYINDANVFVLSSIKEGLPNVLLESLYIGTPIVTTYCVPFVKEIINNGQNGYVVPVGNFEDMAKAMVLASSICNLKKYNDITNSKDIIIKTFLRFKD